MTENDLKKYRAKIDEIDKTIAECFEKRMQIVGEISKFKIEKGIATYDASREQKMKQKNIAYINDVALRKYYLDILDELLKVSKQFQEELKKNQKSGN